MSPSSHSGAVRVIDWLAQHRRPLLTIAIGATVAIGSSGLFLGGLTVLVAYLLMQTGMGLVTSLMAGFFAVGILGMGAGLAAVIGVARARGRGLIASAFEVAGAVA